MANIVKTPDTQEKLSILSQDSQYDLACACGTKDSGHRQRSVDSKWLYPVTLPDGGTSVLLKTLVSNVCINDCGYCPLRVNSDPRRCTLEPEEIVKIFLEYFRLGMVFGLFISSGVTGSPDSAMERINKTARILRKKENFRGYIHLKIIPGASDAAIEEAVSLSSAVSINIETPGDEYFRSVCTSKDYLRDIIHPVKLISRLTAKGGKYSRVKQTTQFVVGAADEKDRDLIKYSGGLYKRLNLNRIYFSAYQRGAGEQCLPGEKSSKSNSDLLTREHRLYQVDWLLRKYGFNSDEIPFETNGNLSLDIDPKEKWAMRHPEFFPVDLNRSGKMDILRVPGLGPVMAARIIKLRKGRGKIRRISDLGKMNKRLGKAEKYVKFGY